MTNSFGVQLHQESPPEWVRTAVEDFPSFLVDHAACERKASTTGMMFVVRYPDRTRLVETMIALAREELMHFHQVWRLLTKRGLFLKGDEKNEYVNSLLKNERHQNDYGLLDRLLIFGLVEARGCERFGLMGRYHPEPEMKEFYSSLAEAEKRHHEIFVELACEYFPQDLVQSRLHDLATIEAELIRTMPVRAAVH